MSTTTVDDAELNEILGRFVTDLGGTAAAGNIVIGGCLGLYRALAEAGPLTAVELAEYTGTVERYVREWLRGQAAGQLASYGPDTDQYWMTPAQAHAFADPDGLERFRSGEGFAWGGHGADVDPVSIQLADKLTAEAGLGDKVRFTVAAADFPGSDLGLVTTFDGLHDMDDRVAAAQHIRSTLAADGVWLIAEPYAISDGAPDVLANQAGERPIARVIEQAGFGAFRRATETPFHIVYEARP